MKEFQYITWQPVDFPPTTPKNTQDAFRNYSSCTNIPGNRLPSNTKSTANTGQPKQPQRTNSSTESSSSTLDADGIMCLGKKKGPFHPTGHPQQPTKVSKVNGLSTISNPIDQSRQSYFPSTQVWDKFPPIPKPIIPDNLAYNHHNKNQIIVTSPASKGTIIEVKLESPKKLPANQKAITKYCKQSADQITKNISHSEAATQKTFVDPTYDAAFKYLFSQLEFAQSFISSLLELKCNITSLKPINVHLSELQQGNQCNENQASLAVDGLFKIKTDDPQNNKMLVFLEMQRKPFPGFLTREQIYSALIATNAVKKGVSKQYDKIPKVVGIIIALKSILPKEVPYCSQISTRVQSKDGDPINVNFSSLTDMRIFELQKFQNHPDHLNINKNSSYSLQWLSFLLKCGKMKSIPDNISDTIIKAYNHMTRKTMTPTDLALIEASRIKAKLEKQALEQHIKHTAEAAERKGQLEGKILSAVTTIQNLLKIPNIDSAILMQAVAADFTSDTTLSIVNHIKSQQTLGNTKLTPKDIIKKLDLLNEHTSLVDTKVEEEPTVNLELQEPEEVVSLKLNLPEDTDQLDNVRSEEQLIPDQGELWPLNTLSNDSWLAGLFENQVSGDQETHNID